MSTIIFFYTKLRGGEKQKSYKVGKEDGIIFCVIVISTMNSVNKNAAKAFLETET